MIEDSLHTIVVSISYEIVSYTGWWVNLHEFCSDVCQVPATVL